MSAIPGTEAVHGRRMSHAVARTFTRHFAAPVKGMWTALADTSRYNEASGLPRQRIEERAAPDGTVTFLARARFGPFGLVWDDLPCNWVTERWFEHRRLFHGGPFRSLTARFGLTPEEQGCRGDYRLEVEPRGALGGLVLALGFMRAAERAFRRLAAQAEAFAQGAAELPFQPSPPQLPAAARERSLRIGRGSTPARTVTILRSGSSTSC